MVPRTRSGPPPVPSHPHRTVPREAAPSPPPLSSPGCGDRLATGSSCGLRPSTTVSRTAAAVASAAPPTVQAETRRRRLAAPHAGPLQYGARHDAGVDTRHDVASERGRRGTRRHAAAHSAHPATCDCSSSLHRSCPAATAGIRSCISSHGVMLPVPSIASAHGGSAPVPPQASCRAPLRSRCIRIPAAPASGTLRAAAGQRRQSGPQPGSVSFAVTCAWGSSLSTMSRSSMETTCRPLCRRYSSRRRLLAMVKSHDLSEPPPCQLPGAGKPGRTFPVPGRPAHPGPPRPRRGTGPARPGGAARFQPRPVHPRSPAGRQGRIRGRLGVRHCDHVIAEDGSGAQVLIPGNHWG